MASSHETENISKEDQNLEFLFDRHRIFEFAQSLAFRPS